VSTPRDELRELLARVPDEQVTAAASDLTARRARLTDVGRERQWPPACGAGRPADGGMAQQG